MSLDEMPMKLHNIILINQPIMMINNKFTEDWCSLSRHASNDRMKAGIEVQMSTCFLVQFHQKMGKIVVRRLSIGWIDSLTSHGKVKFDISKHYYNRFPWVQSRCIVSYDDSNESFKMAQPTLNRNVDMNRHIRDLNKPSIPPDGVCINSNAVLIVEAKY